MRKQFRPFEPFKPFRPYTSTGPGTLFIELEAGQGVIIVNQLLPLGDDLDAVAGNEENIVIQEAA
jgi:hypothetical protein